MGSASEAYGGEPPFVRHSATSEAAAAAIGPHAATLRATVLRFLVRRGRRGATDEEMQHRIPMAANTQRPRRRELQRAGLIYQTERKRRTLAHRWAFVWRVTPTGYLWFEHLYAPPPPRFTH